MCSTAVRSQPVLPKQFLVKILVESDQHSVANLHRGCAKVSGWPQHQSGERRFVGAIVSEINSNDFFAFGDHQLGHPV